jgi:hypothetical protein
VLHAFSRVRLGLDLAFNDHRRPGLESGGEPILPSWYTRPAASFTQ